MANIVLDFLHNYQTGERRETEPANAYQYDEGHVLEAVLPEVITACEIHYWIRGMEEADAYTPTSITQNEDDSCTVLGNIPNSYFETNGELRIYIVVTDGTASITTYEGKLHICQRSMPDDYVDDDPENEAVRVLTEAQAAAATATEKAGEAAESAEQAQEILDSIPEDYTELTEEVSNLKDELNNIAETEKWNLLDGATKIDGTFLNVDGTTSPNSMAFYFDKIQVDSDTTYYFYNEYIANDYGSNGYDNKYCARTILFYDSNEELIQNATSNYSKSPITTPSNCKYLSICGLYKDRTTQDIGINWLTRKGINEHEDVTTIIASVPIENVTCLNDEKTSNIRIPMINFQFDDGAANDANIVSIFNSHGFTCGFAIISNMPVSDVSRYLEYQASGYEIICHADNGTGMGDETVSPETIENRLSSSKSVLESYGFKINGFVTPSSTMANVFKPILRKYYEWAETVYFGEYTGTGQPYMKPVNGVYNGWRVSLQSTTLANQKAAVDACIENYGCLTFYGHAAALDTTDYLTTENLEALLTYIANKVSSDKVIVGTPSEVILNYFSVRNDDVSDGWVDVTNTDASLDERFSVNSWRMKYNEKLGLLWFAVRVAPTEAVSGQIPLFTFPKSVFENQIIPNESGRTAFSYEGKLLITGSNTWSQGTNYRFSGMLKLS